MSPPSPDPRRERRLFGIAVLLTLVFRAVAPSGRSPEALAHDVLLLTGSWLLARTWFASPASAFFVAVAAAGADAPAAAALPLLVWLLHGVLETGAPLKLFLALGLAGAQALDGPPGTALVCPVAAALAFPALAWTGGYPLRERLRALDGRRLVLPAALGTACALAALALALRDARPEGNPVERFLAASTFGNPLQHLNLVLGLTPDPGFPLFAGSFTAALALAAVLGLERRAVLRLLGAVAASLAILGAAVAPIPGAPAAAGAAPLRLLVVFLAGSALDRLLSAGPVRTAGALMAASAVLMAALSLAAETSLPVAESFLRACSGPDVSWTAEILAVSAFWSAAAGGTLLLRTAVPRAAPLALALLLFLHPLDVLGWKFRASWLRRPPAAEARVP